MSDPAEQDQATGDVDGGLTDIVVTAQRRRESAQRVPITITALDPARLKNGNVSDISQLQQLVPGLKANSTVIGFQPFLRGIGYASASPGLESPTTLMIDEVYSPSPAGSLFSLNSVQQIEVLKGPQGTLFGRNATAGAISIKTRDPGREATMDADIEYGSYENVIGRFYGSTPVSEKVSANVALYYQKQFDGWGRNLFTGKDLRKGRSFDSRAKILFELDDVTSLLLTGWYNNMRSDYPATTIRQNSVGLNGYVNRESFYDARVQDQLSRSEQEGGSLKFSHELGWATLIDIASYQYLNAAFFSDNDGTAGDPRLGTGGFFSAIKWKDRTITNEVRLVSPNEGQFTWTAGLYYLHEDTDPALFLANNAPVPTVDASQTTSSIAPFAQATWEFLPKTRLTLGGRYNTDKRSFTARGAPDREKRFSKMTYRVSLDHQFTQTILGFASFNRGYHAGAYSLQSPTAPVINPEIIDAFEVGIKSELFDRHLRVNIAGFHYDYQNVIIRAFPAPVPGQTTGGAVLSNAAKARLKGVDVDFVVQAAPRLSFAGGFEILDAKFTDWPLAAITVRNTSGPLIGQNSTVQLANGAGRRLTNAPKFSGNIGVNYSVPTSIGDFALDASYSYRSLSYWDPGNRISEGAYGIANASITWKSNDERFNAGIFARNLGDVQYFGQFADVAQGDVGAPGAPRTISVRAGVHF
jgi:iron complex outermembrane receptor protein